MKALFIFVGIIVLTLVAGLLKSYVALRVIDLFHLGFLNLQFYEIYGVFILIGLVTAKSGETKEEEDWEARIGKVIGVAICGPLLVWLFAWIMSLILVH